MQPLDLGQGANQFLGQAVAEVGIVGLWTQVDKRQYRDGFLPPGQWFAIADGLRSRGARDILRDSFHSRGLQHELVEAEVGHRQGQQQDDGAVKGLARANGARRRLLDVLFQPQALRRDLEDPGQQQAERKADRENGDQHPERPVGKTEEGKERFRDFDKQPRGAQVGDANAKDIAAFELLDEGHRRTDPSTDEVKPTPDQHRTLPPGLRENTGRPTLGARKSWGRQEDSKKTGHPPRFVRKSLGVSFLVTPR